MAAETIDFAVSSSAGGTVTKTFSLPLFNLAGTVAPTAAADDAAGYAKGSMWVDTVAKKVYFCTDNTTGAAVWLNVAASGSGAPSGAGYIVDAADVTLTAERVVTNTTTVTWDLTTAGQAKANVPGGVFDAAGAATSAYTAAAGDLAAHVAASDPHPGYLTAAEGNAAYQPLDADLTAFAALASAADQLPYATGAGAWALTTLSAFGRTLIDDANAAAARTTLGLGTAAVLDVPASGDAAAGQVVKGNDSRLATIGHGAEVHTQTTGTGTIAIPAWAVGFDAVVIGGGGGAGSGRVGAAASIRPGGQGGGPGARTHGTFAVADLGGASVLYYDVGTGGAGGTANAGPSTDGVGGGLGNSSSLRITNAAGTLLLLAGGGGSGTGGSSGLATGQAAVGGSGHFAGGLGGVASTALANVTSGSGGLGGSAWGGGAGGSITSANALIANSTSGPVFNATALTSTPLGGLGGSGTVAATAAAVAAGGNGSGYGAGGGGSGGATNTFGTGKGGDGAAGVVWVRFYA